MNRFALIRYFGLRVFFLFLGTTVFIGSYYYGATLHLSSDDAKVIAAQITTKNKGLDQPGIFFNNVKPALGMFVPVFGAGLGIYSGYSTGLVFGAFAQLYPVLKNISPLAPFGRLFAIMEVLVYGVALSRSGMLTYDLVRKKKLRAYIVHTAVEISIVVVVLFIASIFEWQTIQNRLHPAS